MRWQKVEIGKVSKVISGFAFKSKDFQPIGTPVIKIKNIKDENIVLDESDCVDSAIEVPLRFHLSKGDILISLTGSHITLPSSVVGRVAKYRHETNSYLNQRAGKFINIDNEKCVIDYLFYFLLQKETLTKIANKAQGAANQANISPGDVEGVEINLPPLPTQRKIASILSAYDDLIENNLKRIKLLEEKALMEYRILFKENKLKEFPIEDVWEIKYGKNLPQTKITEFGKYPVYGAAGRIGFYEEFNYEFPVALVTSRGNGSGVAHRTNQAAFVTNNSFAFVPKEDFVNVHFHLAEMILRDLELTQLRSGTAQPQLTIAGLIGVKLKLPNKEALIEYNKIVDPSFDLIHTLEKQNTKLREARDILLPKLMNGQIEV